MTEGIQYWRETGKGLVIINAQDRGGRDLNGA